MTISIAVVIENTIYTYICINMITDLFNKIVIFCYDLFITLWTKIQYIFTRHKETGGLSSSEKEKVTSVWINKFNNKKITKPIKQIGQNRVMTEKQKEKHHQQVLEGWLT